jgi:hypothetical protein
MNLLVEVVSILRREKIDHALIGAAAMAVYGVSRATADIDFLTVDGRVLEADLWKPLEDQGVTLRILKGDFDDPLAGSVRLISEGDRMVDVVVGRYKWQKEVMDEAEVRSIGDVEVPVARPAGLVLLKLHAGGPKDAWDITSLAETHEDWASVAEEVDSTIGRLSAESRRLWKKLREES